jgi:hypothetical protein
MRVVTLRPFDRETGKTGKSAAKLSGIRRKADVV